MAAVNPSTPLAALEGIVLDTETTGLDARVARLVQIGAVRVRGTQVLMDERLERLVAPGIPVPPETTAIHGITDAHLREAPAYAALADEIEAFIGGNVVIGHTIAYDLAILERETKLAGRSWRLPPALDVRLMAVLANPGLAHHDLDRVAAWLGVIIEGRHTAIGDAVATARVYAALVPLLRERGIRTLGEVAAAGRRLSDRQASAGNSAAAPPTAGDLLLPAASAPRVEGFAYRHRIADVMSFPPVKCAPGARVREAMRLMLDRRVSSTLVDDAEGEPGIFTERDLLRLIDRHGTAGLELPVSDAATRPLQTVPHDAFIYRAIGRMDRLGIRHLGVSGDDGSIVGLVTTRNLLRDRASHAIVLGDAIDSATEPHALAKAWGELPRVAQSLLDDATDPRAVAAVVSAEIAALTHRAAELAEIRMLEAGHGSPPVPYAVLVLGSVGRGESLLAADQDNAIVFADGPDDGAADRWFATLGGHIADILDEAGVPYCKGGVMAKNAEWRHSTMGWRAVVDGWMRRQQGEDLLSIDIFFDGLVVHGDRALGDEILDYAYANAGQSRALQVQLGELARRWSTPLGWLGRIKTDEAGRIDLKKYGLLPIFTAARYFAIRHGIRRTGTRERLEALIGLNVGAPSDIATLISAHATLLGIVLAQQLRDGNAGVPLSPRVAPAQLSAADRDALKAAIASVPVAVDLVGEGRL